MLPAPAVSIDAIRAISFPTGCATTQAPADKRCDRGADPKHEIHENPSYPERRIEGAHPHATKTPGHEPRDASRSVSWLIPSGIARGSELVVHAQLHRMDALIDSVEVPGANEQPSCRSPCSYIRASRPLRSEGVFDAGAGGPADTVSVTATLAGSV